MIDGLEVRFRHNFLGNFWVDGSKLSRRPTCFVVCMFPSCHACVYGWDCFGFGNVSCLAFAASCAARRKRGLQCLEARVYVSVGDGVLRQRRGRPRARGLGCLGLEILACLFVLHVWHGEYTSGTAE